MPHLPPPGRTAGTSPGALLRPLAAMRLSDQLADRLSAMLEQGIYAPGERLPTEPQLAAAHGVSRTLSLIHI